MNNEETYVFPDSLLEKLRGKVEFDAFLISEESITINKEGGPEKLVYCAYTPKEGEGIEEVRSKVKEGTEKRDLEVMDLYANYEDPHSELIEEWMYISTLYSKDTIEDLGLRAALITESDVEILEYRMDEEYKEIETEVRPTEEIKKEYPSFENVIEQLEETFQ